MRITDHKYNSLRFYKCSVLAIVILANSPLIIKSGIQIVPAVLIAGCFPIVLVVMAIRAILARDIDLAGDGIQTKTLFGSIKTLILLKDITSITRLDALRNLNFFITEYALCYIENNKEKEFKFFVGIDKDSINIFNGFLAKVEAAAGVNPD